MDVDATVDLLGSTGIEAVDVLIRGFIGLCELHFPGRIRSYALAGSYRDGSAVPGSDIDLVVIFGEAAAQPERERFWRLHKQVNLLSPVEFGCLPTDLEHLSAGVPAYLGTAPVVYGEDLLSGLPRLATEVLARRFVAGAFRLIRRLHRADGVLRAPLGLPDPAGPFCGFELSAYGGGAPTSRGTTKRLANTIARIAGAIVLLEHGRQPESKRDSVALYRECVADPWSVFASDAFADLNGRWHYRIPETAAERRRLRELCERLPAFENQFLDHCRPLLRRALRADDEALVAWAAGCLERIALPDPPAPPLPRTASLV